MAVGVRIHRADCVDRGSGARRQGDHRHRRALALPRRAATRGLDGTRLRRSRLGRPRRRTVFTAPLERVVRTAGHALSISFRAHPFSFGPGSPSPTRLTSGSSSCGWHTTMPSSPISMGTRSRAGGLHRTGRLRRSRMARSWSASTSPFRRPHFRRCAPTVTFWPSRFTLLRVARWRTRRRRPYRSTSARPAASGSCVGPISRRRPRP